MEDGSRLNKLATPKAGFIYPLASEVVPEGFLLCDGAEYLRAEYPELFAAIGTIYGEGDGSTTFNVPNLQTRVPVGKGDGYELGDVGGEESHTLTVNEMPEHVHTSEVNYTTINTGSSENWAFVTNDSKDRVSNSNKFYGLHSYSGASQSHNNMQPYTVVNYIIATGKNTGVSVSDIVLGAQAIPLGIEYGGTGANNAETARSNLGITPENIGAVSMELLWENASPNSDFAEQNIDLDLSDYWGTLIIFRNFSSGSRSVTRIVKVNEVEQAEYFENAANSDPYYAYYRAVAVNLSYIKFTNAYLKQIVAHTSSLRNDLIIPLEIYGIKGVSV